MGRNADFGKVVLGEWERDVVSVCWAMGGGRVCAWVERGNEQWRRMKMPSSVPPSWVVSMNGVGEERGVIERSQEKRAE